PSGTFLGLSDNAANAPVPAPVGHSAVPARIADSGWRPSRARVADARKARAAANANRTFAPAATAGRIHQMAPVPDPADAPKTVSGKKAKTVKTSGTWSAMEGTSLRQVFE